MKGKKTGGRNWKLGQSGNPAGRIKIPDDVKEARKFNAAEATRIITKYLYMNSSELELAITDPETPAMELMLAKIIKKSAEAGDHFRLNFLLDRTIGKVTEKINVKMPKPTVIKLLGEDAAVVVGSIGNKESEEDDE